LESFFEYIKIHERPGVDNSRIKYGPLRPPSLTSLYKFVFFVRPLRYRSPLRSNQSSHSTDYLPLSFYHKVVAGSIVARSLAEELSLLDLHSFCLSPPQSIWSFSLTNLKPVLTTHVYKLLDIITSRCTFTQFRSSLPLLKR